MKNISDKKKVALYLRVSSQEQKREGLSINTQLKKLNDYCDFKGWEIFKIYKDEGISGSSIKKRQSFKQMLEESSNKRFSTILITKFDRAFRNTKEALNTFDDLREKGIDFVSIGEDIDTTTAMGKFFFIVISAFAELERGVTFERSKDIWKDKFEMGLFPVRPPFGYKAIKLKKKVVGFKIDPKEAEIVRKVFNLTISGHSYKEVCQETKLKPQQYYNILRNRAYCGYVVFEGHKKKGLHEPIISEEIFNELQTRK